MDLKFLPAEQATDALKKYAARKSGKRRVFVAEAAQLGYRVYIPKGKGLIGIPYAEGEHTWLMSLSDLKKEILKMIGADYPGPFLWTLL